MAVNRKDTGLLGRRDLLGRAIQGSIGLLGLGGLWVGLRTLWPRTGRASALRLQAGRPDDYAVGQVNQQLFREHWVWVIRSKEGFYALSARCTHLGCRLRHQEDQGSAFRCACHASRFTLEGEVLTGPATRPLERVFIQLGSDGLLLVDPTVRYRKEHGEWDRPGAWVRYPQGGEQG